MSGHTPWYADEYGIYGWSIFELRSDHPTPPIAGNLTEDVAKTIVREHNSLADLLEAAKKVGTAEEGEDWEGEYYMCRVDHFEALQAAIAKAEGRS